MSPCGMCVTCVSCVCVCVCVVCVCVRITCRVCVCVSCVCVCVCVSQCVCVCVSVMCVCVCVCRSVCVCVGRGKGEAGLQTAWGLLRRTVPSRFLHVLRGHAVDVTAELNCDEIQDTIHRILAQWTDQGGLTAGQQRIVELPIEHGGLGFLPVKDLAAIARLSALASLPENSDTHSFREAVINKEGLDLEARLQSKMETPPKDIVGNVHVLPAGRSAKAISRHLTKSYLAKSFKDAWMHADHFVPQLKHCWLRNVNKHTLKAGQGAPGMGHWLYTLPTAPFTKVANGPFNMGVTAPVWACVTRCRASLWQAAPWCETAVQGTAGRHRPTCCLVRKACQGN